jgi:hypothetical protein
VIITKKIEFFVKDSEHEDLEKMKGIDTWRVFFLTKAGVDAPEIKLGRPQAAMDDLYGQGFLKPEEYQRGR